MIIRADSIEFLDVSVVPWLDHEYPTAQKRFYRSQRPQRASARA
jgi:hypothetical protein